MIGVDIKSSRPASGWITGATAARTESVLRLSLRHDATVRGLGKAAFASPRPVAKTSGYSEITPPASTRGGAAIESITASVV
jgi:hypothetical protein